MLSKKIIFAMFSFMLVFSVQAENYVQDIHYQVLEGERSQNKEVTEYFSFYCPHCFTQEPMMLSLVASLPVGTKFNKNHVDKMPGRNVEIEHSLTKALIVSELLHIEEKMVPVIFNTIHVSKTILNSSADVKNLFIANGVDGPNYDKIYSSFAVSMQFNQMQQKTAALRKQGVGTVPTVIVNGKYRVLTKSLKGEEDFLKLVAFLLNKNN
ncbi:thiol:disulfide interchange protein DsbA/DsbL [Paraglaciecola hydrolytica]|uniref:Thiol:disulfide interchange protein n=1 Tax=Paraglaciecola hydrolytica TaxID=1799789 RepID=A0A136A373_9ALTE|nr:thiol:disulfide interchange protein DsbA/DsbL [Paraglaciecola hydrolytica]KXI29688.1 hypothetical protein AX660_06500 [Paraglaciecola hydrolytica]